MIERIRTFIEIRLSEKTHLKIIESLSTLVGLLSEEGWRIKWVHPDNVHLTLRFLGNIDISMVGVIKKEFSSLREKNAFVVRYTGMGAFPSLDSPRVIWIGVDDIQGGLADLAKEIESKLQALGFEPEEKEFRPHVTVGRVNGRGRKPLTQILGSLREEFWGEDEVREFIFMKSVLTPKGPIHTPLWNIYLKYSSADKGFEDKIETSSDMTGNLSGVNLEDKESEKTET